MNSFKLKTGLLWYDDDPDRTLAQKIERAAVRYEQKLGERPTICLVDRKVLEEGAQLEIDGILVESSRSVLAKHLWLGRREGR